jgi:hypothetical protein
VDIRAAINVHNNAVAKVGSDTQRTTATNTPDILVKAMQVIGQSVVVQEIKNNIVIMGLSALRSTRPSSVANWRVQTTDILQRPSTLS